MQKHARIVTLSVKDDAKRSVYVPVGYAVKLLGIRGDTVRLLIYPAEDADATSDTTESSQILTRAP